MRLDMDKKRFLVTFIILILGVVLLAVITRIWLTSSGLDKRWKNSGKEPLDKSAVVRTVEEKDMINAIISPEQYNLSYYTESSVGF